MPAVECILECRNGTHVPILWDATSHLLPDFRVTPRSSAIRAGSGTIVCSSALFTRVLTAAGSHQRPTLLLVQVQGPSWLQHHAIHGCTTAHVLACTAQMPIPQYHQVGGLYEIFLAVWHRRASRRVVALHHNRSMWRSAPHAPGHGRGPSTTIHSAEQAKRAHHAPSASWHRITMVGSVQLVLC